MKKLLSCVLAVSMIFGMSVGAFAKKDDDDDFRASDSRLYLDGFDDDNETLSPGDTETFSFVDKRDYDVEEGTDTNVDGRYDVTYSKFKISDISYKCDNRKADLSKIEKDFSIDLNGDRVTISSPRMDDEDFEEEYHRGVAIEFKITCLKEWKKLSDGSTGKVDMSGSFEVWISAGDVSGNNQYGIELDIDEDELFAPGTIYEFDLEKESGSSLDPDDEEKFIFSVKATKGSALFDIFKLVEDKEGHYMLQFRGDVSKFDNNVKDVEITTSIREKGSRDKIEKIYKFQLGYEEVWEDNSQFDIDSDSPLIRLDSDLDRVEASVENYCKIAWRRLDNRGYNFTYDEREDASIVKNNKDAKLKFLNFRGKPEFAAAATVKLNIYKTPYVYEYDNKGNLTKVEVEVKDGYTSHFMTNKLGNYVFSSKVLSAANIPSTPKKEEPVVEKPVEKPAVKPTAPVQKPAEPVTPPTTTPQPVDNLVKEGIFDDNASTNFVQGKYNPPTGIYTV